MLDSSKLIFLHKVPSLSPSSFSIHLFAEHHKLYRQQIIYISLDVEKIAQQLSLNLTVAMIKCTNQSKVVLVQIKELGTPDQLLKLIAGRSCRQLCEGKMHAK